VPQRFFGQMIMASKVPEVAKLVQKSLADDRCCVIGLQSTGEAGANNSAPASDDLFSNAANVILNLVTVCVCAVSFAVATSVVALSVPLAAFAVVAVAVATFTQMICSSSSVYATIHTYTNAHTYAYKFIRIIVFPRLTASRKR